MKLHIDFETFSKAELSDVGSYNYSRHPSTGVHCLAYVFGDGATELWTPRHLTDVAVNAVIEHVAAGKEIVAHNAGFELDIWNNVCVPRFGWPTLHPEQCVCTMAMALAMSLPAALDKVAPACGLPQRKDMAGARIMKQLATPKPDGTLWKYEDDPEKFKRLYAYCVQDVEVERALERRLMPLSAKERTVWAMDYRINRRGVMVDIPAVRAGIELVTQETERINRRINRITTGAVSGATDLAQMKKWVKQQGVVSDGLAKADILELLSRPDLPDNVTLVLKLRREAAKASTAKLRAMDLLASEDGRCRGVFQYHGASTGRWAGRKIQLQNLPRGRMKPKQIEDAIAHFGDRDYIDVIHGDPMDVVSSCLRAMVIPAPGHTLIASDFSNIEGRMLAWLAGEEWKLQAFRDFDTIIGTDEKGKPIRKGPDIYVLSYAKSFNCTLEEALPHRQVGKVQELALGYQGGKGAFQQMAVGYGVKVSDDRAEEIKTAWRQAHPKVVQYWRDLEKAATSAVRQPGQVFHAGPEANKVSYKMSGSFLWCRLPSGRVLCYPYPELREAEMPWKDWNGDPVVKQLLTFMAVLDSTQRKKARTFEDANSAGSWVRVGTYGGSLAENVTQAASRDVLVDAMLAADEMGLPIAMHVHDEIVIEPREGGVTLADLDQIMQDVPHWATGLPIASAGWAGHRYRKG